MELLLASRIFKERSQTKIQGEFSKTVWEEEFSKNSQKSAGPLGPPRCEA
jgi:hypothetical protein